LHLKPQYRPLLRLTSISLLQFKNYRQASFAFDAPIVGISGINGIGKTNLLDCIYYLCFTRSYFSKSDQQHVFSGSAGFRIQGNFMLDGMQQELVCILRETGKKEFSVNGEWYEKFSSHIGRFPCVMIAPDDLQIITGGTEERRRFMDALLCQLDPVYLSSLMEYNRIIQQRNSFLKSLAEGKAPDRNLLDVYDDQLGKPCSYVFGKRQEFLGKILPLVREFYLRIAGCEEPVGLTYQSQLLQEPLRDILRRYRDRDIALQRTGAGIHKDDIDIRLGDQPFRTLASQGQRKSMLFALKLSEYELLKQAKGFAPVLLLDDVFEKLDAGRMHNLLSWVCLRNEGQIFITDTHPDRILRQLKDISKDCQLIEL
jgi:DNA replication and repair protein RecF